MKKSLLTLIVLSFLLLTLGSCASLELDRVDFGWPVESELSVDNAGMVREGHFAISFSVSQLSIEEFQDSTALRGSKIRILRNPEGYYFITGPKFKNVYVFRSAERVLDLKSKISVSTTGLRNPALNQRPPYVELLDNGHVSILLTSDAIEEGKKP